MAEPSNREMMEMNQIAVAAAKAAADAASKAASDAVALALKTHEELDWQRFREVREDLKEHSKAIGSIEVGMGNIKGRMTVLGALALVLIPVLTEIAHVLFDPNAGKLGH